MVRRLISFKKNKINWDAMAVVAFGASAVFTLYEAANDSTLDDADMTINMTVRTPILTKQLIDILNRDGIIEINNVLSPGDLKSSREGAISIYDEGRMKKSLNDSSVRQDDICWIREDDGMENKGTSTVKLLNPTLLNSLFLIRHIAKDMESMGYNRSINHKVAKQCQLSRYSGGGEAIYRPHRDAASSSNFWEIGIKEWLRSEDYRKRKITVILYLNESSWDVNVNGGALRCYMDCSNDITLPKSAAVKDTNIRHITPTGGKMVIFDSRYLVHDVAPSYGRDRYALTTWVTGDD